MVCKMCKSEIVTMCDCVCKSEIVTVCIAMISMA